MYDDDDDDDDGNVAIINPYAYSEKLDVVVQVVCSLAGSDESDESSLSSISSSSSLNDESLTESSSKWTSSPTTGVATERCKVFKFAMELECDLGAIQNEELLRKMPLRTLTQKSSEAAAAALIVGSSHAHMYNSRKWQQSEDSERKKQIRTHLYKLRESRLRNLYSRHEPDMSESNNGNALTGGFGKDPLVTSHGDALLDQNFQSLKSKEVRDSMSPTHELKFHSMTLTQPNTTGWDVQTSSEVSPDGRAYRTETLAKTDGVEKLNGGGVAEFKGRNEQRSSASHQGDDKNYVKKAAESSNTHLQEKVVFGDESSGRTEMKMSSTTSSSTSKFVSSSSSTVEYDDENKPRYLLDSQRDQREQQREQQQKQQREEQRFQELQQQKQQREEQRFQELQQREEQQRYTESREQLKSTRNVETQQHYEDTKRYVDMDKASPEYQRHVQHLMSQPGEIISNTVEYPKPNVKMITTVKRLPDGTIVKNKRYETEQLNPSTTVHQSQTQTQQQQQQQRQHQTQQPRDVVDNVETVRRGTVDAEELTKQESYSSVKKSSRRYSTETTSETIEETVGDDRAPQLKAPSPGRSQDYTQGPQGPQGFPSVKTHKPTQEFPHQRPSTPSSSRQSPSNDFSTHGFPSVKSNKPTQEFPSQRPLTTDGAEEIVVLKSEKSRNVKQSSSTQRTTETQYVSDDHAPIASLTASTPSWEQPASPRRAPVEDYSTHGFPSAREPIRHHADQPDADLVHHSTTVNRKQSHKSNTEHIIETQLEQDNDYGVEPEPAQRRAQPLTQSSPRGGTQGFPSARSPNARSPLSKSPPRKSTPAAGTPSRTPGRTGTGTTETTTTTTVTRRQLQKEREVDAAHRAFAASLRSSSPAESTTSTGSHHHHHHGHQTPRSSISSSRTYRRDGREGSHDSHAPSESSRISSTTVTRHVGIVPTVPTTVSTTGIKSVAFSAQIANNEDNNNNQTTTTTATKPVTPTTTPKTTTTTTSLPASVLTPTPTPTPTPVSAPLPVPVPVSAPVPVPVPETSAVTDNQSQYTEYTITKTKLSTNDAKASSLKASSVTDAAVNEPQCVRRHYYKLGPSDKDATATNDETNNNIATSVTKTETVAATTPKSPRPQHAPYRSTPTSHRKPYHNSTTLSPDDHVDDDDDDDEPIPARRSSKSPSVERRTTMQRETTFESTSVEREREFPEPEQLALIDDQIVIDESTIEVGQRNIPKPKGVDKPRESPRSSPEKQLPGTVPSKPKEPSQKQVPANKESPRQSPEKQLPPLAPWKTSPAKETPERQLPGSTPKESPRESPEKQLPPLAPWKTSPEKQLPSYPTKDSPRANSPERQLPSTRESPRQSPEKQLPKEAPIQAPKESPRSGSPVKQQPALAPWKTFPSKETPEKQLPLDSPRSGSPKESSAEPKSIPSKPNEKPRSSPERQLPTKPRDAPQPTPDKQQPTQFLEDAVFRTTVTQKVTNTTKNLNEEFISNERQTQPTRKASEPSVPDNDDIDRPSTSETPDGGFVSKSPASDEEEGETKPTYRKKGLSRRETFEDRCRKILGMEEDGDTQGNYVPKPEDDVDDNDDTDKDESTTVVNETETFEFKIEDCPDDDDEDDKPRRVTETILVRTKPLIKVEEPLSEPESEIHHRTELTVDVTESEQIETFINTEKSVGKKAPKIGKQPKDEDVPRPTTDRYPKDEVEPRPAAGKPSWDEPKSPTGKHPKQDAETFTVEENTTVVTTKRTSKDEVEPRPAAGKPSWSTPKPRPVSGGYPKDKVEPRPVSDRHPKDDVEPRPAAGKPSWDDVEPRPAAGKPSWDDVEPRWSPKEDAETFTVEEETTVVTTKRTSKDEVEPGPAAEKPSWSTPKKTKEASPTAPRHAKDDVVPRPAAGRPSKEGPGPRSSPGKNPKEDAETITVDEETSIVITNRPSKSPSPERKTFKSLSPTRKETETTHFVTEKIIDCNGKTVVEKISKNTRLTDGTKTGPKKKQPHDSEPEESQPKSESKKPQPMKTETERSNSRTTKPQTTTKQPPQKTPTTKGPRKESLPRRESGKRDSLVEETRTTTSTTTTRTTQKDRKPSESNIKDRLRSSPRKQKPNHPDDDVDGQSSSPDTSPSRVPSERRRSSNISVHTEIIIDHTSPKTERKMFVPARKLPVTERKESAPVPRVTRRDKDKVTRSTSENVIKVINGKPKSTATTEMSTLNPISAQRPSNTNDRSRPSKCFTTKTINLSEQLINSEEMENVIIDIQHAKSSREPSPDRIVPTPVPAESVLDSGKPRYPDVVQEPDDEPKKKPVITNIPIFEEEANAYVGCQISELRNANGIEADIHDNPTVEAPQSLDYPSTTTTNGVTSHSIDVDECLLSVHEKVSKFTHTAEQVKQPKTSVPFSRQFDEHAKVSASDECLLSIDQKVDRFLKTAENITKQPITPTREIERPSYEDIDEELRQDDCILSVSQKVHKFIDTAEKLAPTAPQKSPRLVANIERHISRQSEPESEPQLDQESEPEQPSDSELETKTTTKRVERLQEPEPEPKSEPESDDELQPMSKHHTTTIELKRQKDILNRPSVFGQRPVDRKPTPTKQPRGSPSTTLITEERRSYRNQTPIRNTNAPRKPSLEKQPRGKPSTTKDNETRKSSIHSTTSTSTSSSTTKRREHIAQQQWVLTDVDVDVEEVGPAPAYHSGSPQATSPGRRTTPTTKAPLSSVAKPTTEETGPKSTLHVGSSRPTSPGRRTTGHSPNTTVKPTTEETDRKPTSHERVGAKPTTEETGPKSTSHVGSPRPTSPGRRTTSTAPSTRAPLSPTTTLKPTTEETDRKPTSPNGSPRPTSPGRRTTVVKTTTEETRAKPTPHSISPQPTTPSRRSTTTSKAPLNSSTVVKASTEHHSISTTTSTTNHTTRTHSPTNQQQPITLTNLDSSPDSPTETTTHVEPLLDRSRPTQTQSGRTTVASRRNIFEKHSPSPTSTTATEPSSGRRPSYMDHTKSSLEHMRRDSLEITKTHYSRKSSIEDDSTLEPRNPNAAVKFDVPMRRTTSRSEPSEDIDIEEIFDLVQLEQLLETVSSYELRRRIRAQMRLIKKNMINAGTSTTSTTTTVSTTASKRAPEQLQPRGGGGGSSSGSTPSRSPQLPRRTTEQPQQPRDRSYSPIGKTSPLVQPRDRSCSPDSKTVISSSTIKRTETDSSTTGHGKPPVKPRERSASPAQTRTPMGQDQPQARRRSPTTKMGGNGAGTTTTTTTVTTRTTTNGSPRSVQASPDRRGSKPSPIWADRSKVLRGSGSASPTPRKGSASSTTSSSSNTTTKMAKTSSSSTSSTFTTLSKRREEDSITSSYGVGPTDENGLPLFGIRALKKKTQPMQPASCETKQEVTGYVIEEQFYADDKSAPRHERKELIYSSNPEELATLQQQLESKSHVDANTKLQREFKQITGPMDALDTVSTRRDSAHEINERFIRKESTASSQLKSKTLIQQELADEETEDSESNDVCSVIEVEREMEAEADMEMEPQLRQKSSTSSTSRTASSSTRSFLNTSGEERIVSSVDDVLERMRNADNVVEPGDTSEDREARALLNKFLGASVIMQGVESMLPAGQRQQQQQQSNRNSSNSQAVKTTRISSSYSKTGNSSNTNSNNNNNNRKTTSSTLTTTTSSAPVTRTTCDIEEIWDEQLLRQLLEQASTYEERRKIRARLRELMAEREEQTILKAGGAKAAAKVEEEEESSASEYEEIIEEVTDDSDEEEEQQQEEVKQPAKQPVEKQLETKSSTSTSSSSSSSASSTKLVEQKLAKVELSKEVTVVDGQQGESLPQKPEAQPATAKGTATAELGAAKAAAKAAATAELGTTLSNSVSNSPSNKLSHSSHSISQKSASVVVVSPKPTKTDTKKETSSSSTTTMQPQQQVKRLSVPQKEDSGTESGEDLRLLAAGLRDTLQQRSVSSGNDANDANRGLLEEVTDALSRLECSLKLGQELAVDGGQRQALLSLIARLQSGLTAPDKLPTGLPVESSVTATDECDSRTDQSESSNRQRFAKRRQRNSRHTVGVSREELADARRYMEDMLMLHPPQTSVVPNQTVTAATLPLERVASSSAIVGAPSTQLYRPNQFVPNNNNNNNNKVQLKPHNNNNNNNNRRPLSGDYGISFASYEANQPTQVVESPRFNGTKKQLMKRANTIDIPKAKAKYSSADCDTDSELEDRNGPNLGLKRAVQVSVKRRVQHVVPPFEPKTENDHKFLAFINKQNHQGGLGWAGARSVSNWTHKFGNIKHTFETGVAATATKGKPPQPPMHHYQNQREQQQQQQQQQLQLQQQQQQAHLERQRRQELERQLRIEQEARYEREQRARLEREYYEQQLERQHLERQQQLERQRQQQEQLERQRRQANAPNIYKPIAQKSATNWQSTASGRGKLPSAPQTHLQARPSYSNTPSPASTAATSPIGLPWVAKPRVDNSDFKRKAHHFEERSLRDNLEQQQQQQPPSGVYVQRHNSLRSKAAPPMALSEFKKRPSLPNAMQPEMQLPYAVPPAVVPPPPPPTNISFTYADYAPATTRRVVSNLSNYRSQPCLSSAALEPLTNPLAAPLVLTNANPTYLPTQSTRHYDFASPIDSPTSCLTAPIMTDTNTDDDLDLDSDHNMHEYRAEIKVMRKPRSQTAVTVAGRRTAHVSDDEVFGRNSRAAKSLLYTMKQLGGNGNGSTAAAAAVKPTLRAPTTNAGVPPLVQPLSAPSSPSKPACLSPDGRLYQAPLVEPLFPQLNSFEANRQPQYQAAVPPSQPSQPSSYAAEAQTSYVVTYPLDDSADEQESSLSLSRMRRSSEHSNASSSLSMTSWTANPMHVQQAAAAAPPPPPVDRSNKPQLGPKPTTTTTS
ncbi:hypothetical protein ACLKA6_003108 [Drosophila palustris]